MSNILKQYRVAGEDKNVRVINSNSMIKQIFADSISHPADSYTGISSDAQSSLGKTKSLKSVPAIQFGQYGDNALFIETEFGDDIMMNGYFILMPDPDSYDNILSALGISF